MKRVFFSMILSFALLSLGTVALGQPLLQLDIVDGAFYDATPDVETIVTGDKEFTLIALLNPNNGQFNKLGIESDSDYSSKDFFIVASWNTSSTQSFTFDGSPVSLNSTNVPTNPQLQHGELGLFGEQFAFNFNPTNTTAAYDTQLDPGGFDETSTGPFIYEKFEVDLTGLDPFVPVHFDLYSYAERGAEKVFAPFSHDASAVPEPATMLLLGSGLAGLAAVRRKMRKK